MKVGRINKLSHVLYRRGLLDTKHLLVSLSRRNLAMIRHAAVVLCAREQTRISRGADSSQAVTPCQHEAAWYADCERAQIASQDVTCDI